MRKEADRKRERGREKEEKKVNRFVEHNKSHDIHLRKGSQDS